MKVTEKSLKFRCTELNLGVLKDTSFGIRFERTAKGYMVELQYRDGTPSKVLIQEASASEAAAAVEGVALGAVAVKDAGTGKPEYVTRETYVRQGGERCPKCQSKDISPGHLIASKGIIIQHCSCVRCDLVWNSIFRLDDYDCSSATKDE